VKIADFGVSYFGRHIREVETGEDISEEDATDFDDDLELAKTVGTPAFFAPELCYTDLDVEQPEVTEQIDVWSLGVTLTHSRFSHDTSTSTASSSSTTNPQLREEIEAEAICRKWTYMIPRPTRIPPVSKLLWIQKFLQTGWNLIESEDAGTRQHIITKLDAETGLAIIKTLTDIMDASQKN
jgi:serine/threonine protein kinase